ncbi:MAG TPA: pyridoxal phosphate-dependent aminotransferase [bacterium]|nr:pyridoxal phosphate-dependent aminotransferase [bacterium]
MKSISTRSSQLIASPIRKFYPLAVAAEQKGIKIFKLNIGDPDLAVPTSIRRSLAGWGSKKLGYAPSSGLAEHVDAWRAYYKNWGVDLKREEIVPTTGASEGILFAFLTVADPGDEILVFEPLYTNYKALAGLANVRLRPITLKLENNFRLPKEREIIQKITPKTKAIVVINPDNPTGKVWSEQELKLIIKIAKQHNLYIIADETYREIVFHGHGSSILSLAGSRERVILLDSISKRFSAPGIRIGVIVSCNKTIQQAILKVAMARLSAPTIGQIITNRALKDARVYTQKITKEYSRRAAKVESELKKIPGIFYNQPQGAFYQVIALPINDAEDFIRFMLADFDYQKKTVWVSPMADFYITPGLGKNEIRLAYVVEVEKLREAVEILGKGLEEYTRKR